jgi:hypothetical protein
MSTHLFGYGVLASKRGRSKVIDPVPPLQRESI